MSFLPTHIPLLRDIQIDADGFLRIRLDLHEPATEHAYRLVLRRRGDGLEVVGDIEDGAQASIAATALLADESNRWDVRLQMLVGEACQYDELLRGAPLPAEQPRHFFQGRYGDHGLSAYFTESANSLALYIAEAERHARIVATENARHMYQGYLSELPLIDNLVFFESFLGKTYSGNPRYLYEFLLRTRPDLQFVWSYDGLQPIPGNPRIVSRSSADYYRLLAQARYRVNNVLFPVHGRKPETFYLQTWHGTPLKRLSFDIELKGPEVDARENFYRESRSWSCLLSENAYSTQVFRRAFRYDGEILEAGYPLTDPLLDRGISRAVLAERLGLPAGKRFILYAPTWRDNNATALWQHRFDLKLDLEAVSHALEDDQVLLIRAHHLVSERLDHRRLPANVIDLSALDDINELCMLADVLITDYSSVFFDFAVTGRPILFYCYDLEEYANEIRGFYLDVHDDLPGPVARSTGELLGLLARLQQVSADYASRYREFQRRFCSLNDGRAAERVAASIFGGAHAD